MTTATDLIASGQAPSLLGAGFRMAIALLAIAFAAWVLLRWRKKLGGAGRRLHVIERTLLARGASIALVEIEGRRLLVGVSADGVRLLRDCDDRPGASSEPAFGKVLAAVSEPTEVSR